jgi:hypothetical protein
MDRLTDISFLFTAGFLVHRFNRRQFRRFDAKKAVDRSIAAFKYKCALHWTQKRRQTWDVVSSPLAFTHVTHPLSTVRMRSASTCACLSARVGALSATAPLSCCARPAFPVFLRRMLSFASASTFPARSAAPRWSSSARGAAQRKRDPDAAGRAHSGTQYNWTTIYILR